ncbi:MAG: LamG domain-containing protein [Deltaproteobacteria bacterium]|nr:LamG domain-containing protein [Deltaproteobacteria bacterium]
MGRLGLLLLTVAASGCSFIVNPELPPPSSDAGPEDASGQDASAEDAGAQDAGADDAGVVEDSGVVDAGPTGGTIVDDGTRGGQHAGTEWGDALRLVAGVHRGRYTSAVLDLGFEAQVRLLSWRPDLPYALSLAPATSSVQDVYPGSPVRGDALSVLIPMDGSGQVPDRAPIVETSGSQVPIAADITTTGSRYVEGVFGSAIELARGDHLAFPNTDAAVQFGDGDLTWSLFARTATCTGGNNVFIGSEARPTHMWLGCGTSDSTCPRGTGLGGTFLTSEDAGGGMCTAGRFDDGRWHHLAATITGHEQATLRFWLDGVQVGLQTYNLTGRFDFTGQLSFTVGAFPVGDYDAEGAFDEVALFKRALEPEELASLAKRGLGRVRLQVRACPDASCSGDQVWTDAQGTAGAYIEDPLDGALPRVELTGVPATRWLQYRVELIGAGTLSPSLERVQLEYR